MAMKKGFSLPLVYLLLAIAVTLILLFAGQTATRILDSADAGTDSWTAHGPSGKGIYGLAQDPGDPAVFYGAGENGVYKSTDGGVSWSLAGLSGTYIYDVAIDPQDANTVFAAVRLYGLYKSTDAGASWNPTTLLDHFIYDLQFDPVDQSILYAGAFGNLYKITDSGSSWTSVFQLTGKYVFTVALDPDDHTVIYVGTGFAGANGGIYRYMPAQGWTWLGPNQLEVYSIDFDPNDSSTIYAGTYGGGFYKSADNGETWNRTGGRSPESVLTYAGASSGQYSDPVTLSAVLGYTQGLTNTYVWDIEVDAAANPSTVYAATDNGVYKSDNGGARWWEINAGLTDPHVNELFLSSTNPVNLLAGSWHDGVFSYIDLSGPPGLDGKDVTFDIGNQSTLSLTDSTGAAVASILLSQPAGNYSVTASFAGDSQLPAASDSASFVIEKEDASLEHAGDSVLPYDAPSITLAAELIQKDDGYPGDISGQTIDFTVRDTPDMNVVRTGTAQTDGAGTASTSADILPTGVYEVTSTLASDLYEAEPSHSYLAIYDPDGGFVTGGGWIDSPEGAYPADTNLTGKADFGFVSKYKKGASIPTGATEFHFQVADLNFHSASYDWLVVAGARAQYKGEGTINGLGNYGFMLTAIDGALPGGGGEDKFRIKIWDKDTEAIIFDNQMGDDDAAEPATTLGGGSIVIHNK